MPNESGVANQLRFVLTEEFWVTALIQIFADSQSAERCCRSFSLLPDRRASKPPAMKTAAVAAPAAKKRRTEAHEGREPEGSHGQEPPRDSVDSINCLPDDVLGVITSLLPTKDAYRTQTLDRSTWRRLWTSAFFPFAFIPLNIDCSGGGLHGNGEGEANVISSLLAAHPGPARRLSIPVFHLHHRPSRVDIWLHSPALNSLQELHFISDLYYYHLKTTQVPLPVSALWFSATLREATFSLCHFPENAIDELRFPQLWQLGLQGVEISGDSLHNIISGSPVLECLLLSHSFGFRSIWINSPSLVSIGLHGGNLIIEDAPLLERLIQLQQLQQHPQPQFLLHTDVSMISAPKLETLGCLSSRKDGSKYTFGTTILQELKVDGVTTEVRSVKILAIPFDELSIDMVIDLISLSLLGETVHPGRSNCWDHKHRDLVNCLDIPLKTVVLADYRGTKSQVNFAKFFVLKAKRLVLMRFVGDFKNYFIAEQHRKLKLEERASRCAQFDFTRSTCKYHPRFQHIEHVGDLSKTNPSECGSTCVR